MNLPRFPEFKLVGLEDKPAVEELMRRYPSEACEITFANIFIWRNFEHTKLTTINDNLCFLCESPSEPAYFLQPIGSHGLAETIDTCLLFSPRLSRIPESFVLQHCPALRREEDRNNFDYVYRVEDLIHLRGKKYDGKRNRIKKFERSHRSRYLRLSSEHLDDCRRLFEEWVKAKAQQDGFVGEAQKSAILEALGSYKNLGLTGGAVEVEGQIEAFSVGERLNAETAVIHIEIVNPAWEGLAQFINREFVKNEWVTYRFINREQDIGIPGLRRAKASYHPHHLVKKFNVWR